MPPSVPPVSGKFPAAALAAEAPGIGAEPQAAGPPDEIEISQAFTLTPEANDEAYLSVGADSSKPDDLTWGDWMLKPGRPLSARHKELARLLFLGKTNNYIADTMGLTPSRVSILRSNTQIALEVARLQEKAFELTIQERLTECGPVAMDTIENILRTDDPNVKVPLKKETAIWVLEKLTGKASQSVQHESSTLDKFYELMSGMQRDAKDVTDTSPALSQRTAESATDGEPGPGPGAGPERSKFAAWTDENL